MELSLKSGLVTSSKGPNPLYEDLKAFKDERERPGKRPLQFVQTVLVDLEMRFQKFIQSDEHSVAIFSRMCGSMEWYSGLIAVTDVTLLEREQVLNILWPSAFAAQSAAFLDAFHMFYPVIDPRELLASNAPLGTYLHRICKKGATDFKTIAEYRAVKNEIDVDNCRDTLDEWLKGKSIPGLENLTEVMKALGHFSDTGKLVWLFTARLLSKISPLQRSLILRRLNPNHGLPEPFEHFRLLKNKVSLEVGVALQIGQDRPWLRIRQALYDPQVQRNGAELEDMIARLTKTWEPIAEKTQHEIDWFNGRYLALQGRLDEAYPYYVDGFNGGLRRNKDVHTDLLDKLLALAGKLGKAKDVERFHGLILLTGNTEWDGSLGTMEQHFERKFPVALRYPP